MVRKKSGLGRNARDAKRKQVSRASFTEEKREKRREEERDRLAVKRRIGEPGSVTGEERERPSGSGKGPKRGRKDTGDRVRSSVSWNGLSLCLSLGSMEIPA